MLARLFFTLTVYSCLVYAMGADDELQFLGIKAAKDIGKKITEISAYTDGKIAGLDVSSTIHKTLHSALYGFDNEAKEELAYFMHANHNRTADELPKAAQIAFNGHFGATFGFTEKISVAETWCFIDGRPLGAKEEEVAQRRGKAKIAFEAGVKAKSEARELHQKYAVANATLSPDDEEGKKQASKILAEAKAKAAQAGRFFNQSLYRDGAVTSYVIALCKQYKGTRVFVSNYETDTQITLAFRLGQIHFAIAEDSDYATQGVDTLFGGVVLKYDKKTERYNVAWFNLQSVRRNTGEHNLSGWEIIHLQLWSCLRGNDYTKRVTALSGVGVKHAYLLVEQFRAIQQADPTKGFEAALTEALRSKKSPVRDKITAVLDGVNFGMAAFNGQWVYDISTMEQRRLDPKWPLTQAHVEALGDALPEVCEWVSMCGHTQRRYTAGFVEK